MIREALELEIIRIDRLMQWNKKHFCETRKNVDEFIYAWKQLAHYYWEHDDRQISVEMIRIFREATDFLYVMAHHEENTEGCRDRAKEDLEALETLLTDITEAVDRSIYPDGR
jgi:hypothetical protein